MRKDSESVMFKGLTGETQPYPSAQTPKALGELVNTLKVQGYEESVEVVRTSTGSVRHVSIEGSVGGSAKLARELQRKDDDGQPVFMRKSEYDRLTPAQKTKLLDDAHQPKAKAVDPVAQRAAQAAMDAEQLRSEKAELQAKLDAAEKELAAAKKAAK